MSKPDWVVIAQRELVERVRTPWFVVVTLLGPLFMIGMIVVPALLASESGKERERMVVVDLGAPTSTLGQTIVDQAPKDWTVELAKPGTSVDELLHRIKTDEIDGFLTLPADLEQVGGKAAPIYQGDNATNQGIVIRLNQLVIQAVLFERFGKDPQAMLKLAVPMIDARHTTGETAGQSGTAIFIAGYAVMIILYMSIVLYAVNVMRSVVQEKTNRIVEIMAAAAKPRALMFGKILGVGAVGLIQIAVWAAMALFSMHYRGDILGAFGVKAAGWTMPPLGPGQLAVIVGYFLLGYFFYASLYAAIGAMVSSEQEAQQAQTPVLLLLIVPMVCMQLVANDPRGGSAQLLTMLPFSAPILMPMRFLLDGASYTEVGISMLILALSTWLVAWVAARIYRVGILLYGKRPSLRELGRWIRHS